MNSISGKWRFWRRIILGSVVAVGAIHLMNNRKLKIISSYDRNYKSVANDITESQNYEFPLGEPDLSKFEQKQVQIIFRHGARTSCTMGQANSQDEFRKEWKFCHTDEQKHDDPKMVECDPCQLTAVGEKMCISLGQQLRKRYHDIYNLFGDKFDETSMHVESTIIKRARQSLRMVLRGLFPNDTIPNEYLDTNQDSQNSLNPSLVECKLLNILYNDNLSRSIQEHDSQEYQEFIKAINSAGGNANIAKKLSPIVLMDWATSRAFHGLPLIKDLPEGFLQNIENLAWKEFSTSLADTSQSLRLGAGILASRILENIYSICDNNNGKKLILYSGHDTTLALAAKAQKLHLPSWPPYSSHIEIELWKSKDPSCEGLHNKICYHTKSTNTSPTFSKNHLTSYPSYADQVYNVDISKDGTTQAVDITKLDYVQGKTERPLRSQNDEYWVRIVFNGDVIASTPLVHIERILDECKELDTSRRSRECNNVGKFKAFNWGNYD